MNENFRALPTRPAAGLPSGNAGFLLPPGGDVAFTSTHA
jgi:hypothetical protein